MHIQPTKTAVVGCGVISAPYLKTMTEKFKILDVVGCCDLDQQKSEQAAEQFGIQVMTKDELLADASIEIVLNPDRSRQGLNAPEAATHNLGHFQHRKGFRRVR